MKKIIIFYMKALLFTVLLAALGQVTLYLGISETIAGLIVTMLAQLGPFLAVMLRKRSVVRENVQFHWMPQSGIWCLIAIGIPVLINTLAVAVVTCMGQAYQAGPIQGSIWIVFILTSVIGCIGEETAWRGYLIGALNQRRSVFISALITGVLWGAWHFTKLEQNGIVPYLLFIVFITGMGVIMGWIYDHSDRSLICMILFHLSINMTAGVLLSGREGWLFYTAGIVVTWLCVGSLRICDRQFFAKRSFTYLHGGNS